MKGEYSPFIIYCNIIFEYREKEMALYRDSATGGYITLDAAKAARPNVSVGNPLSPSDYIALGINPVIAVAPPTTTLTEIAVLAPAVQNAQEIWTQSWLVIDVTKTMTPTQLISFKQNLYTTLAAKFSDMANNLVAAGFKYDFSPYTTDAGISCATLTPNGIAGLLTIQMDQNSQINWLGTTAEAQFAIADYTYQIASLAILNAGIGYTTGTGYVLTATGNGTGFAGTIDVTEDGALTNPQITSAGTGYTGNITINIDASAGTPTTSGVITATAAAPPDFPIRVFENYNIIVPAADTITILSQAAKWKTGIIFTAASVKDQLNAMIADTTKTANDMLAVTWPQGASSSS